MSTAFELEDPGEGIREAEVLRVLVSEGDEVSEGDPIFEVETDKAAVEVSADFTGTVSSIEVAEGDIAQVGDVMLRYDSGDGKKSARKHSKESDQKTDRKQAKRSDGQADADSERKQSRRKNAEQDSGSGGQRQTARRGPIPAAPSTRRLARELDVDIARVEGTGPQDRVTDEDVRAAAEGEPLRSAAGASGASGLREELERFTPITAETLHGVRRATAEAMAKSWREVPHVMHHDLADIDAIEELRARHAGLVDRDAERPSLTAYLIKALAAALRAFPRFNASLDAEAQEILYKERIHIGVAVATDRGLLVPVFRDVDSLSLRAIASELERLAQAAQDGELGREDMLGGSMTITNVGALGGRSFTPIIKQPEVGILGVGASYRELVPADTTGRDHRVVTRLPLSFAFDHRVNDGADAARFVNHIRELLADRAAFSLEV